MQVKVQCDIIANGDFMNKDSLNINDEKYNPNNDDPALRFDAFMGGVKDGGLRSVSSISIMVCYIVANMNGLVTAEVITRAMDEGMLANHFEVASAISKLIENKTIIEAEDGALSLNTDIKASIDLVEKDLPLTVREQSMHLVQKIIAKETYKRENEVIIIKNSDGTYTVKMTIAYGGKSYLDLSLYAPTIEQANSIKERFITSPVKVYDTVIEAIFANEE